MSSTTSAVAAADGLTVDIALPVLNEEAQLEAAVATLRRCLAAAFVRPERFRLVIADNGSRDRTAEIGARLAAATPQQIGYLRLAERGVGRALKAAWTASSADIVGYMDVDLATDLRHLPEALAPLMDGTADIVTGTRLHPRAAVEGRRLARHAVSRIFNRIVRSYMGVHISDAMCGFKFLRRPLFAELHQAGAQSDGWFFCAEILILAEWMGYRVAEIPVHWRDRAGSRVRIVALALEYLKAMRALSRQRAKLRAKRTA